MPRGTRGKRGRGNPAKNAAEANSENSSKNSTTNSRPSANNRSKTPAPPQSRSTRTSQKPSATAVGTRTADSQIPAHTSPARLHRTRRHKAAAPVNEEAVIEEAVVQEPNAISPSVIRDCSTAVFIKDIKVQIVSLEPKKVNYVASLNNSRTRISIGTDSSVWAAEDRGEHAYQVMMHKCRDNFASKADELELHLDLGIGPDFMEGGDWPWKYLWCVAEKKMIEQQVKKADKGESVSKGYATRDDTLESQQWERGEDYGELESDRKAKDRAKAAVMLSVGKHSKKNLTKAETILSGVVSDLSEKHNLNEAAVVSTNKASWRKQIVDAASNAILWLSKSRSASALRILTGTVFLLVIFESMSQG